MCTLPRGVQEQVVYNNITYTSLRKACSAAGLNPVYIVRYRDRHGLSTQEAFDVYAAAEPKSSSGGSNSFRYGKECNIDGVHYSSITQAREALGIDKGRLQYLARVNGVDGVKALEIALSSECDDSSWTADEICTLIEEYREHGSDIPELRIKRTAGAIRAMARRIGIASSYSKPLGDVCHSYRACEGYVFIECSVCGDIFLVSNDGAKSFSHDSHGMCVPAGWRLPSGSTRFSSVQTKIHKRAKRD